MRKEPGRQPEGRFRVDEGHPAAGPLFSSEVASSVWLSLHSVTRSMEEDVCDHFRIVFALHLPHGHRNIPPTTNCPVLSSILTAWTEELIPYHKLSCPLQHPEKSSNEGFWDRVGALGGRQCKLDPQQEDLSLCPW